MGQNHLRVLSLLKGVDVAFIADAETEKARHLGATYGVPVCGSIEEAGQPVDAVVICTPTCTHADQLRRVSMCVNNIFIEKPLASTFEEAKELHDFVREHDLRVQVGFIERYNPAVQQLKTLLDKSPQVINVDFTRTNKLSSRITDVDVVADLMIHDIDLSLYINGPVQSISAHGKRDGWMIDFASALLTHENGRFSRILASRVTEKKLRTIQATCDNMFVDCELVRKEILINRQSEIRQNPGEPYTIASIEETVEVRPQEALLSELQAFVSFCHGATAGIPNERDGLNAAVVCHEIQQAILR
jgi:predicted dehydrogenase